MERFPTTRVLDRPLRVLVGRHGDAPQGAAATVQGQNRQPTESVAAQGS
jgi:hypothetical protein